MAALAELPALEAALGRTLSGDAAIQGERFLSSASNLVLDEGDSSWTDQTAPARVVDIVVEAARRAVENPGAHSQTSVGDVSVSYRGTGAEQDAIYLTRSEHRSVKKAAGRHAMSTTLVSPWNGASEETLL